MTDQLDRVDAIARLHGFVDQHVTLYVSEAREDRLVAMVTVSGRLTSGWLDAEIARTNGVEDMLPFTIGADSSEVGAEASILASFSIDAEEIAAATFDRNTET